MIYWINLIDWNGQVKVSRNLWIEEIYFKMHKFIYKYLLLLIVSKHDIIAEKF